jgi:ribonuclease I
VSDRWWRTAALLAAALLPARAAAEPFDYWMLALSWSPQYCERLHGRQ